MATEEREKALKCLRKLRNYLTDDTDLKLPIHDEKFLLRFVRSKKYDAEKAHTTVRKYFKVRQTNSRVFKIALPSDEGVKEIIQTNVITVLKHKDPLGRRVIIINMWDVEKYNLDQMMAATILVNEELLLTSIEAQINGIVTLYNGDEYTMQHVKQHTIKRIKTIAAVSNGSFPGRNKGFHTVNEPGILDLVVSAVRPFLPEKTKERLMFYGKDLEKLHKVIPVEILPGAFGGELTEEEAYDKPFIKTLLSRNQYYQELLEYGYGNWESDDEDTYM